MVHNKYSNDVINLHKMRNTDLERPTLEIQQASGSVTGSETRTSAETGR